MRGSDGELWAWEYCMQSFSLMDKARDLSKNLTGGP